MLQTLHADTHVGMDFQNRPFYNAKRPISQAENAYFTMQKALFYKTAPSKKHGQSIAGGVQAAVK